MVFVGAMATPDGVWRVEVHRERREERYRILRGGEVYVWHGMACAAVVMGTVVAVLAHEGVDMGGLMPVGE